MKWIVQLGQGTLGLQESEYYSNETEITLAYRQFMTDLATAMTNDTLTITNDVLAMYLFEQDIAKVILFNKWMKFHPAISFLVVSLE